MNRKQFGSTGEKMIKITNSLNKCFCGHPFDSDGVCANLHLQDEIFFLSENVIKKKTAKKNVSSTKLKVFETFTHRCICYNGHIIRIKYSNN